MGLAVQVQVSQAEVGGFEEVQMSEHDVQQGLTGGVVLQLVHQLRLVQEYDLAVNRDGFGAEAVHHRSTSFGDFQLKESGKNVSSLVI